MKKYDTVEYLGLNKLQRFDYKLANFFIGIPDFFVRLGKKIGHFFVFLWQKISAYFVTLYYTFVYGDWKTKLTFVIFGFGNLSRRQIGRGLLFLAFEIVFILYMVFFGGEYVSMLGTLGEVESEQHGAVTTEGDNSFYILLFGILSIFFIIGFLYTWNLSIKQSRINEELISNNKKLASEKDDLRAMVDQSFYKTLLALPLLGILIFTVMPIFFMILVAFTNYDASHSPPYALFTWVGWDNFVEFLDFGQSGMGYTFGCILLWTLVWAFFATFLNYFLGMLVAMLINKKGLQLKKVWRTILVFSIAIPQFVALIYVSHIFDSDGFLNGYLVEWGILDSRFDFWADEWAARILLIVINVWIGIPYLMLITTGILMNIPADLYESAKIDGASPWKQYSKITLPYMLFVTGPYLLTSFVGNINNFNVIYLLSGGGPTSIYYTGSAGKTDLLITWLFDLVFEGDSDYATASVIGILIFAVVAILSLIVYNVIPSTRNEEDFAA